MDVNKICLFSKIFFQTYKNKLSLKLDNSPVKNIFSNKLKTPMNPKLMTSAQPTASRDIYILKINSFPFTSFEFFIMDWDWQLFLCNFGPKWANYYDRDERKVKRIIDNSTPSIYGLDSALLSFLKMVYTNRGRRKT